jgi:hypothetical protein
VAQAVQTARDCYEKGLDWRAARKVILQKFPASFGMYLGYEDREPEPDVPAGPLGYDAPSNIGITLVGWYYGEGDFGKSLCIAAGCGEDGDCTAATLGAVLGIIAGADALPEKWVMPIGDGIKTISLDRTASDARFPNTVTELTSRVCALMPVFMQDYCDTMAEGGTQIAMPASPAELYDVRKPFGVYNGFDFKDTLKGRPYCVCMSNVLFDISIEYADGINIKEEMRFDITLRNGIRKQQWLTFRWLMPEGWTASAGREFSLNLDQPHGGHGVESFSITLFPCGTQKPAYDVVLEISSVGRLSKMYVPVKLLNSPQTPR